MRGQVPRRASLAAVLGTGVRGTYRGVHGESRMEPGTRSPGGRSAARSSARKTKLWDYLEVRSLSAALTSAVTPIPYSPTACRIRGKRRREKRSVESGADSLRSACIALCFRVLNQQSSLQQLVADLANCVIVCSDYSETEQDSLTEGSKTWNCPFRQPITPSGESR